MRDLVAVKRIDKHGREVTRWVKPSNAPNAVRAVPGPSALGSTIRDRLIRKLSNAIGKEGVADGSDIETVRDELSRYSDSTLMIIKTSMIKDRGVSTTLFFAVREHDEREAREISYFDSSFPRHAEALRRSELLNGLRTYTRFHGIEDLTELDEEQHDLASALLNVGYAASFIHDNHEVMTENRDHNRRQLYFTDQRWITLIEQHQDRTEDIDEFITGRNTVDVEAVKEYLSDRTPLREGYL